MLKAPSAGSLDVALNLLPGIGGTKFTAGTKTRFDCVQAVLPGHIW